MEKSLMQLVGEYCAEQRRMQTIAETTIRSYGNKCRAFIRTVDASDGTDAFSPSAVRRFLTGTAARSPRSINNTLFALRHFARWLIAEGVLKTDPTLGVELAKPAPTRRTPVSDEDFQAMLTACERIPNVYRGRLAKAMIATAGFGGLRRCETLALRPEDVNFETGCLTVWKGKGKKHRDVYPCRECLEILAAYMQVRPRTDVPELFLLHKRKRIYELGYSRLFEEVKTIGGLRGRTHIKPHALRHTCATRLHRNGAALIDLKDFLGHSSVITTERYLHTGYERLKGIAELGALRLEKEEKPKGNVIYINGVKPSEPPKKRSRVALG